jgi:leucyl-tRNA synthetase
MQLFNCWYNTDTDKAEKIDTLIQHFNESGNSAVKAVCDEDTPVFSASQWNSFSENNSRKCCSNTGSLTWQKQ